MPMEPPALLEQPSWGWEQLAGFSSADGVRGSPSTPTPPVPLPGGCIRICNGRGGVEPLPCPQEPVGPRSSVSLHRQPRVELKWVEQGEQAGATALSAPP